MFGLNDSAWNNKGSTTVASFVGFTALVWQSGSGGSSGAAFGVRFGGRLVSLLVPRPCFYRDQ